MSEPNTSATYNAWALLERLLAESSWPPPPVGDDQVAVWFGDPLLPPPEVAAASERVVVVGMVSTPSQEWGPFGGLAREERFRVPVFVQTALDGRSAVEVRERLEQLTAVIEARVRLVNADRTGGKVPAEFATYRVWQLAVASVAPLTPGADAGHVGQAEVVIDFWVRVGTL